MTTDQHIQAILDKTAEMRRTLKQYPNHVSRWFIKEIEEIERAVSSMAEAESEK